MYMSIIRLPSYGMYWSKEIKVECVADIMSLTGSSEIIYNFFVYAYQKSAGCEKCAAFEVVDRLVEEMPKNQIFQLYMNNWFSKLVILNLLKVQDILVTATFIANRLGECPLQTEKDLKIARVWILQLSLRQE